MTDTCCDLLKNSYLCLLNNTKPIIIRFTRAVVICWKIRIFAYWTTPLRVEGFPSPSLWFAEKFVSLLIEQHPMCFRKPQYRCCDLLKNSYLCLLNNTLGRDIAACAVVVICWKIRIFAYWTTPQGHGATYGCRLWFAEKFVSLLIEQHPRRRRGPSSVSCDLLKNSYLCLLNNTAGRNACCMGYVVICWKIRIFAYWTTPTLGTGDIIELLWFAEKFVSLLIEQHLLFLHR